MAPSSMRSGASGSELLAARDARQALLDRHPAGPGGAVVTLSLAIPGAEKVPPGAAGLFAWGRATALSTLPGARLLAEAEDALGPFALIGLGPAAGGPAATEATAGAGDLAAAAKMACVALEGARPAARLLDLDVYGPGGAAVDRASLGLAPRPCLCCDAPARECIRVGRHGFEALVARARDLLDHG